MNFASRYLKEQLTDEEKAAYSSKKKAEREQLYSLMLDTLRFIFSDPSNYVAFLDYRSKHMRYDLKNAILLFGQNRNAYDVRDFDVWTGIGAKIKKGEKGLTVFEKTGYYNKNKEYVPVYTMKKVFDRSQTDLKNRDETTFMPDHKVLSVYIDSCPLQKRTVEKDEKTNPVYFDVENRIMYIQKDGADTEFLIQSLFYEESKCLITIDEPDIEKSEMIFRAKSSAYLLCALNGIDGKDFVVDRIPEQYTRKDGKELMGLFLKTVVISERIYRNAEREKEKRSEKMAMACISR